MPGDRHADRKKRPGLVLRHRDEMHVFLHKRKRGALFVLRKKSLTLAETHDFTKIGLLNRLGMKINIFVIMLKLQE